MTWLTILPYLLSVWTLCAMWLAGSNPRHGWYLALAGQVLWFAYTWASGAWGFLPLNAGLTLVYWRNLRRTRPAVHAGRHMWDHTTQRPGPDTAYTRAMTAPVRNVYSTNRDKP